LSKLLEKARRLIIAQFSVLSTALYYVEVYQTGERHTGGAKAVLPKASVTKLATIPHETIEQLYCIFSIVTACIT